MALMPKEVSAHAVMRNQVDTSHNTLTFLSVSTSHGREQQEAAQSPLLEKKIEEGVV